MTDDWLREIDDGKVVGAVFSLSIILCCWKTCVMALHPLLYCG
jgi:hypothetical protein